MTITTKKIRCRCDGRMDGVNGPAHMTFDSPESLAGVMGWQYGGDAVDVLCETWALLCEGKAVKLTSHAGVNTFQPLEDDEDGHKLARSGRVVYDCEGNVIVRPCAE